MRLKEFINKISKGNWELIPFETLDYILLIRQKNNSNNPAQKCCPISSINNCPAIYWGNSAQQLRIPHYIAKHIVHAADYKLSAMESTLSETHYSNLIELRKILLKTCGLNEDA